MRPVLLSMAVLSLMKMCGGGDEATPPVGAAASGAITVTAQHGGVMVAGDDGAWIELVTKQSGDVEAYVVDSQGAPLPPERASVQAIQVQGDDGRPHEVTVAYDPVQRRYAGHVDVTPVAAQAEVQIVVAGRPPRRAVAPRVVVVAAPPQPSVVVSAPARPGVVVAAPPRVSGTVVVEGPRPPSASVVVTAPQPPGVIVTAPQPPSVVVRPPSASVVVEAPRPPGVVVTAPRAGVVVAAPPRPGVVVVAPPTPQVVVAPPRPGVVVVEGDGHPGRGHAYGRRGREAEARGSVVVSPPRPGAVVVTPPRAGAVVVGGGGSARVEARAGGGGGDRGRGRGRGRD